MCTCSDVYHGAGNVSNLVGSSKNIMGGLFTSSRAMDKRFFCPPDKLLVIVLRCSCKPNVSNIS